MGSNTIAPSPGAIAANHILLLTEDRSRPGNPGEPIKFSTTLEGEPIVTRSAVPMYDSCRVLASRGLTGKVAFVRADGAISMTMDIAAGAKLTISEGPNGPRVRKFDAERLAEPVKDGRKADQATQVVEEVL